MVGAEGTLVLVARMIHFYSFLNSLVCYLLFGEQFMVFDVVSRRWYLLIPLKMCRQRLAIGRVTSGKLIDVSFGGHVAMYLVNVFATMVSSSISQAKWIRAMKCSVTVACWTRGAREVLAQQFRKMTLLTSIEWWRRCINNRMLPSVPQAKLEQGEAC